ncbi:MAG: glycoside hydrolase, partial [Desulfovibrionaceae bacterium]|nr:glycoside hydrolase [Desulfovibrionaceae bacterium]
MGKKLCIHGHFYQPQRKEPWFGRIFIEPNAAPRRHWNERITRESYAPLAWSRRLDGNGKIADLINCYEWMSFNVGPTLMSWLEREEPDLLVRIQEADRLSLARWGHGNAVA